MKKLVMKELEQFECIAGKCPETCCQGWVVSIDPATREKYENVDGAFGEELRKSIKSEDGIAYFDLNESGRCHLLTEDGFCRVYRTLGPEYMCDICRDYPRCVYTSGDVTFASISISCYEAGRMILGKKEKQEFDFYEEARNETEGGTDWESFNVSIRTYTTLNAILQDRQFYIRERLSSALIYSCQTSELMKNGKSIEGVTGIFQNPDQYASITAKVLSEKRNIAEKIRFVRIYKNTLERMSKNTEITGDLQIIFSSFPDTLTDAEKTFADAFLVFDERVSSEEQEQLLVYLLFRHFMERYKERSAWESMLFITTFYSVYRWLTVVRYLCDGEFPGFHWRLLMLGRMSRKIEHSNVLWAAIWESLKSEGMDQLGFQLRLID